MVHDLIRAALREHGTSLVVCQTGTATLAATTAGFTRVDGSFVADGFKVGMELYATGFTAANNKPRVVTGVSDLTLYCDGLGAQSAAAERALHVGLPSGRTWENEEFEPTVGWPYAEEQYIPGTSSQVSMGPGGWIEMMPQYSLRVHVPANRGADAGDAYAGALLRHFPPRRSFPIMDTYRLRVRSDTGPYVGQLLASKPGWAVVPVTFPLRLYMNNLI
jgi:hypothetical protein